LYKNKFPYLIKINAGYIKRIQNENKILFLFAIKDISEEPSVINKKLKFNEFEKVIKTISKKNREYIFSYFDIEKDSYLTNFFNLNKKNIPCLIVYDFNNRKFVIDYSDYNTPENLNTNLLNIKNDLEKNLLQWSHANFIQDILAKFGINLTERGSLIVLGSFFVSILLILIIVMFFCGDARDEEFDIKKKDFLEKLGACKELHEEEKKLILESKNLDSLVRMGLGKIIENLKGSVENEEEEEEKKTKNSEDEKNIINKSYRNKDQGENVENIDSINDIRDEFPEKKLIVKKNN